MPHGAAWPPSSDEPHCGTLRERSRTKQKRITPGRESKQGATRPEMAFAFQGGFPAGICGVILLTFFSMQAAMVSGGKVAWSDCWGSQTGVEPSMTHIPADDWYEELRAGRESMVMLDCLFL